jgi:dTDP-4-dehydrorhamnose reductase
MPRIALIGAAGQLGTDLQRVLNDAVPLTHAEIEITEAGSIDRALSAACPEIVVNTAAYNLVDQAEEEPERAFAINEKGPRLLARWCRAAQVALVHVSTDYVFGADASRKTPYAESDSPGPLGVYGASKLAGEQAVMEECPRHVIVRTCGLYGQAATRAKGNFINTMLRLANERDELRVVNDQHCTPSFTGDVAAMIAALIEKNQFGLYHVTNAGATTWYDLACETFRQMEISMRVIPIPSSEYPTKARRPSYSVLDCTRAETVTEMRMPPWQEALQRYLRLRSHAGNAFPR